MLVTLNQKFLGKKVRVNRVKTQFDESTSIVGVVSFIGTNEFLNKKQVTISRTPIFLEDFNQVELYKE